MRCCTVDSNAHSLLCCVHLCVCWQSKNDLFTHFLLPDEEYNSSALLTCEVEDKIVKLQDQYSMSISYTQFRSLVCMVY